MSLGLAYGGTGGSAVPAFIEIIHDDAGDDLTMTNSLLTWKWTRVSFNTDTESVWTMSLVTDELTINTAGDYRIELYGKWQTVDTSRVVARVERDSGSGFATVVGGTIFPVSVGSGVTGTCSVTASLGAGDKLRITTRRLTGTPPTTTNGTNGPIWRVTKVG